MILRDLRRPVGPVGRSAPRSAPPGERLDPAARPVVGVLAVQGDVSEHAAALEAAGAYARSVKRPEDVNGLAGLVLPGGESTTLRHRIVILSGEEVTDAMMNERYKAFTDEVP